MNYPVDSPDSPPDFAKDDLIPLLDRQWLLLLMRLLLGIRRVRQWLLVMRDDMLLLLVLMRGKVTTAAAACAADEISITT